MKWVVKAFDELTTHELHDLLRLRIDVFVFEQACAYPELDGKDTQSTHLLGYAEEGGLRAYARWYSSGREVVMGRIVVQEEARNSGLGLQLMEHAFDAIGSQPIRISAQQPLEQYYHGFGFRTISEPYDDFGIPHIDMLKEPTPVSKGDVCRR